MAAVDKLTDKAIKAALNAAVVTGHARRLGDGGGLYLEGRPNGAGWWRLRFWSDGKEGMLSLGTYPDVSLKLARERRAEGRQTVVAGGSPSDKRKAERAARVSRQEAARLAAAGMPGLGTFEHVAREWHSRHVAVWSSAHATKMMTLMVNDLFPYLGTRPLEKMNAGGTSGGASHRSARRGRDCVPGAQGSGGSFSTWRSRTAIAKATP